MSVYEAAGFGVDLVRNTKRRLFQKKNIKKDQNIMLCALLIFILMNFFCFVLRSKTLKFLKTKNWLLILSQRTNGIKLFIGNYIIPSVIDNQQRNKITESI